jgi:hypothetical protein
VAPPAFGRYIGRGDTEVDARLRHERSASRPLRLRHCAHRERSGGCSIGYPPEPARAADLQVTAQIRFCKAFEIE